MKPKQSVFGVTRVRCTRMERNEVAPTVSSDLAMKKRGRKVRSGRVVAGETAAFRHLCDFHRSSRDDLTNEFFGWHKQGVNVFGVFRGSLQHGFRNVWHGGEKTGIRHT